MKKHLLLFLGVLIIGLSSCSKKDSGENIPPFDAEAQAKTDDNLIKAYLEAHPDIHATKHSSGLYYEILTQGTGPYPTENSMVTVDYKGELLKGTVFDEGTYTTFLNFRGNVISGWKKGIPLVKQGGKILLILPSALAYGNASPGPGIAPNAIMIFTITLKETN